MPLTQSRLRSAWLVFSLLIAVPVRAQSSTSPTSAASVAMNSPAPGAAPAGTPLTRKQAEALALKNNPQITVGRLRALAAAQYVREQRSALLPTAYLSLTGVGASDGARISAGALDDPIIYPRAATGATVTQLITDFGRTTNLVSSAKSVAKAEGRLRCFPPFSAIPTSRTLTW
jgi:outer membrane protein